MDPYPMTTPQVVHAIAGSVVAMSGIAFLFAVLHLERDNRGGFLELHHYYIAVALIFMPTFGGWWLAASIATWILAAAIAVDDAVQHTKQVDDPAYLSPVHRWYTAVYRWLDAHAATHWIAVIFAALGGG